LADGAGGLEQAGEAGAATRQQQAKPDELRLGKAGKARGAGACPSTLI
jgi:hypothetical protein